MPYRRASQRLAEYLNVGAAAEFLGVSPWTLRNWDKAGKLRPVRHPKNGYRIYRREDLAAVLQLNEDAAAAEPGAGPVTAHRELAACGHVVQFYEDDAYLAQSVGAYIGAALQAGDGAMILVTRPHAAGIRAAMEAMGIDVSAATARGDLIDLDADQTLAQFMADDDRPDPARVERIAGGAIARLSAGRRRRRVHVFGELVARLWADGNRAAAIALEQCWNDLAQRHAFALLCAYPIDGFGGSAADDQGFADVCACHGRVIPAESYAALATRDEQLREVSRLQRQLHALRTRPADQA